MTRIAIVAFSFLMACSCQNSNTLTIDKQEMIVDTHHSGEPNLFTSRDGTTYLSWVEYENDSLDVLKFSTLKSNEWTPPKTIAKGTDWFVNWADFPSLIGIHQENLTAHWLQKSATGTYDYDVHISQSHDAGNHWSPSIILHNDGINAEHGFVSMMPTPKGNTFAVWLDGRNTKKENNNGMTLRAAEIDSEGNISNEVELDNRVCDCCQTGATWTDKGPIVVYRDRSEDEIRDIGIVRNVEGKWSKPNTLFEDKWKIAGCPVNGPSIASESNMVVVAWYTMAHDSPKVLATISKDYGQTFCDPIIIDDTQPTGRVDAIIRNEKAIISWMQNGESEASINVRTIDFDGVLSNTLIVGSNSTARSSGFPRMVSSKNNIVMAWTDAQDSISHVKTFKITLNHE